MDPYNTSCTESNELTTSSKNIRDDDKSAKLMDCLEFDEAKQASLNNKNLDIDLVENKIDSESSASVITEDPQNTPNWLKGVDIVYFEQTPCFDYGFVVEVIDRETNSNNNFIKCENKSSVDVNVLLDQNDQNKTQLPSLENFDSDFKGSTNLPQKKCKRSIYTRKNRHNISHKVCKSERSNYSNKKTPNISKRTTLIKIDNLEKEKFFINKEANVKTPKEIKLSASGRIQVPLETFRSHKKKIAQGSRYIIHRPKVTIFDVNLLRDKFSLLGCECKLYNYHSPPFDYLGDKHFHLYGATAICAHEITFSKMDDLKHILTKLKPMIHAQELVTANPNVIGCTYSIALKLMKNLEVVGLHIENHCFTNEKPNSYISLQMKITEYTEFNKIVYMHALEAAPGTHLTPRTVASVRIVKSTVMFPFESIQWTLPGPKVIVEKVEYSPGSPPI